MYVCVYVLYIYTDMYTCDAVDLHYLIQYVNHYLFNTYIHIYIYI